VNGRQRMRDHSAGRGCGCTGSGWSRAGAGLVQIVEARQTISDNLSGGAGGSLSSLLVGKLFLRGLGLGGGGSGGKVFFSLHRQIALRAGDDQNLFELIEVRGGMKLEARADRPGRLPRSAPARQA